MHTKSTELEEQFPQEVVVTSGEPAPHPHVHALPSKDVENHLAQHGQVRGYVVPATAGLVLVEHDIKHPVHAVLYLPVRSRPPVRLVSRQRAARDVADPLDTGILSDDFGSPLDCH